MFSDRFIEFKAFFPGLNEEEGMLGSIHLNPMAIEAFVPERLSYTTEHGEERMEDCVRVHTKNDVFTIIMDVEQFRNRLNNHYAQ